MKTNVDGFWNLGNPEFNSDLKMDPSSSPSNLSSWHGVEGPDDLQNDPYVSFDHRPEVQQQPFELDFPLWQCRR